MSPIMTKFTNVSHFLTNPQQSGALIKISNLVCITYESVRCNQSIGQHT